MIAAGTKFGVYAVIAPLGAGGMGEVYRARDSRLGRDVALKVLPADLALEPARRARFEQEARHVAALNHPNIVALYDIGSHEGVAYMVTELVDGTSLRGLRLPLRKVLDVAAQVADGLAAAHAAGVTHRDIKPDNVMLTRDGRVKILDFGVAKLSGPFAANAPTGMATDPGALVGTVDYMAPEQVRGEAVDHRADIFAFGVLLYELLSGTRAFAGDTAAEVMTAILRQDPADLPAETPEGVRQIVHRCLEKKPDERFQSAGDLAFALRHLAGSAITPVGPGPAVRAWRARGRWLVVAAFAGTVIPRALALREAAIRDAAMDPIRLTRITADRRNETAPALSPDGRSIAYLRVGGTITELLVKPIDGLAAIPLVHSDTAIGDPVWTPDGNRLCYAAVTRSLLCVSAAGGEPRRLLDDASSAQFAPHDDAVFFIRVFDGHPWLFRSAPAGSAAERVGIEPLPSTTSLLSPVAPDGSAVIAAAQSERWLIRLADGSRRQLPLEPGVRERSVGWLRDSRHVVVVDETTSLIGSRLVLEDTRSSARRLLLQSADPISSVTVSLDGERLLYAAGPVERDIVEYSSDGRLRRGVATSSHLEGFPSWSRAGDRFVYRVGGPGQSDSLWIGNAGDGRVSLVQQLASNSGSQARISPDGGRIAYADQSGIQIVSTSGGRAIQALQSSGVVGNPCWSPDGRWIWYSEGPARLQKLPGDGGDPVEVPAEAGVLLDCSPDGRWLVRRGRDGLVLTTTDGRTDRPVAGAYVSRAESSAQFGEHGHVLYLLNLDRRSVDVVDVETGRQRRTIAFDIPAADQIEGFAFDESGSRVLLTTGGDRNDLWTAEGFPQPATSWSRWFEHWTIPRQP